MGESPQNEYAKQLQQSFGYPLRFPEPKPGLPSSYKDQGLHIGDVGYVDDVGMFEVLFNICFPSDHELHFTRKELTTLVGLTKFTQSEAPPIPNAFPPGRVICHGIQGSHGDILKDTQSAPCKFMSCSASGAILVLSSGAVRHSLNKGKEEEFRKLAEKHALDWCKVANCNSLYLVTGFYKTSSWYLASFHDAKPIGQVLVERDGEGRYSWHSSCDYRQSPRGNKNENQTVLVSGFKIEVRGWDQHTVVEKLGPQSGSTWSELTSLVNFLIGVFIFVWQRIASESAFKIQWDHGARVERVPALSQPFHPSDAINRFILDKNANVQVAVTHDSQWLDMLENNELLQEDMAEEGRFRAFLEEKYTCDADSDNVVYLRRKTDANDQNSNVLHKPTFSPRTLTLPTAPDDIRQIVITGMRAENVVAGLRRIPVGFFALVQFDGTKRRTKTKAVLLHDNVIEWDEEILLPQDPSVNVRVSINASFEYEPMLGNGETLCVSETSVGGLSQAGSTYLHFSSGNGKDDNSCASLLITLEERRFDRLTDWSLGDTKLKCEDPSYVEVTKLTDEAHDTLVKYRRDHKIEDLLKSVKHFELALKICPSEHRAATLFNLATTRFLHCRVHGIITELDTVIACYREALSLRSAPSPDRPVTLLQLSQALLYRYERLGNGGSVVLEVGLEFDVEEAAELATEVKELSCERSYARRAADLVLQTLKRHRVLAFGNLAQLDELVSELSQSASLPLDFDSPHRLINLSAVLRKRFEITGDLDNLEQSISLLEETLPLTSDGHVDKPWILATFGEVLRCRFVKRGDLVDLDKSISITEEAVRLTPNGHFDKPWMLTCLGDAFRLRFVHSAAEFGTEGHPHRPGYLTDHPTPLSTHSQCFGNLGDLEQAISRHKDAVELTPDGHPSKPSRLDDLASSLLTRFRHLGKIDDLERAILLNKDVLELTPDDQFDRDTILKNLVTSLLHG